MATDTPRVALSAFPGGIGSVLAKCAFVTGAALVINAAGGIIRIIRINGLENTEDFTVRLYDKVGPTIGTDKAFIWCRCPKKGTVEMHFGKAGASPMGAAIEICAVTEKGGETGNTTVTGDVFVDLIY